MSETVKNIIAFIGFDIKVLISYWFRIDLRDVGNDMNTIGYLAGFSELKQSSVWNVRPKSCYAM